MTTTNASDVTAIAAAWVPSPASSRLNSTTPMVSWPLDHSRAETVSSLNALMKTSKPAGHRRRCGERRCYRYQPAQGRPR